MNGDRFRHTTEGIQPTIRQLPDIALRLIFKCLVESSHGRRWGFPEATNWYKRYPLLTMSSTCRWWRVVVHSSPSLWRKVFLSSKVSIERVKSCITTHSRMAGDVPLEVLVQYHESNESWFIEMVEKLQRVNLSSFKLQHMDSSLENWELELPRTETLILEGVMEIEEMSLEGVKTLEVTSSFLWGPEDYDALEEVSIRSGSAGPIPSFVMNCPRLRFLSLAGDTPWDDDLFDLELPCMNFTTLEIDFEASLHMHSFYLALMSLPSFRTLIFHPSDHPGEYKPSPSQNTRPLDVSIQCLEIGPIYLLHHIPATPIEKSRLYTFLKFAPNPTRLVLSDGSTVDPIFSALLHNTTTASTQGSVALFSNLQSIELPPNHLHSEKLTELVDLRSTLGLPRLDIVAQTD